MIKPRIAPALALLFMAGCPPPWHTHESSAVLIRSADALNPGPDGKAQPLKVRLYQLRDESRFLKSSPSQLAENPEWILGQEILGSKEITVSPGLREPALANFGEAHPSAKFLGVLALYSGERAAGETWHAAVELGDLDSVVIEFRERTIRIGSR